MTPPARWPAHPAPVDGEVLSSWLHRIGACYQMSVAELVEHGLGLDPNPPPALLDILAERTGVEVCRLRQMSLAGWAPGPAGSPEADSPEGSPGAFDTYVRSCSVLLEAGKRSKQPAGPWRAWMPRYPLQRACPRCADPTVQGMLLGWRFPLQLSCPHHGCALEACIGFPGGHPAWTGHETPERAVSEAVLAMDRRSEQALATGQVDLPFGTVDAAGWFRLVRTVLDEVATPISCWRSRAVDLRRIWAACGHPLRAAQGRWRPFEHCPWALQSQMLEAAAEAIQLLECGTVTAAGADAGLFVSAAAVEDHRASKDEERTDWWVVVRAALQEVVVTARTQPDEARALYNFLRCGCREPPGQILATFAGLGIPTANLSHNEPTPPFG